MKQKYLWLQKQFLIRGETQDFSGEIQIGMNGKAKNTIFYRFVAKCRSIAAPAFTLNQTVNMLLALINKPFPINTWNWYKHRGIGFGLFVFLFLLLFKPFYLHLYTSRQLLYNASIYGVITAGVIFSGGLAFVKLLAPQLNEEKWTLSKQVLLNIVLMLGITFFNVFITQILHNTVLPVIWYFYMLKWVLMIGTLPIVIAELISYNIYLRNNLQSASEITRMVKLPHKEQSPTPFRTIQTRELVLHIPVLAGNTLTQAEIEEDVDYIMPLMILTGENQADRLEITAENLLAVQALDNYVNIYWEKNNSLQTNMLRNTLTNICDQLKSYTNIYRTHRGWLVNSNRVQQVEGNAQGLKLTIDLLEQQVPVSRNNIAGYRQLMQQQHIVVQN